MFKSKEKFFWRKKEKENLKNTSDLGFLVIKIKILVN